MPPFNKDYAVTIRSSARRKTTDPIIKFLSGREVLLLAGTGKWIEDLGDHQFEVLPLLPLKGKVGNFANIEEAHFVCTRFLRPVGRASQEVFEGLIPGQDYSQ